ncbi:MAG TPA: TonB-dependent receptor plug domain-containing protein [Flavobacteriales bacterium]
MWKSILLLLASFLPALLLAQRDSTTVLRPAEVIAADSTHGSTRLRGVEGTAIHVAKKNEVLVLDAIDANKAVNQARQVYARVPGLNIQESDPGGIQLGVGARGLDPNRSSNFNLRQNGYDISADALGYPEAYYTPPMEAVERIEVTRGAASLQYGPQFGGLINFRMAPAYSGPLEIRTVNTMGSYGLVDTYNRLSGTQRRLEWTVSYARRSGESWRPNSAYTLHHAFAGLNFRISQRTRIGVEYTLSRYLAQQPGGLSDAQFRYDPSISLRSRNWFATDWNILALTAQHRFSTRSELDLRAWGFLGSRDALGYIGDINRLDDTDAYRDLIHDAYRNMGTEVRYLRRDSTGAFGHIWLLGARLYAGDTRKAQGFASSGDDADLRFNTPDALEGSDYDFPGRNTALFAEDVIGLPGGRWRIVPGLRFELLDTRATGYYRRTSGNTVLPGLVHEERRSNRSFLLAGIGISRLLGPWGEIYANLSQNYRGITFTDMRVTRVNQRIDPELKDERGFNVDIGWKGRIGTWLNWDVSGFLLRYEDRIGQVQWADTYYNIIRYTTNVGASRSFGVDLYLECDLLRPLRRTDRAAGLILFLSTGYLDARYTRSPYASVEGNFVEYAPAITARAGLTYRRKRTSITAQGAHTGEQFTEATNARFTPNAVNGLIPAYAVFDLSAKQGFGPFELRAGVNNALDLIYFTRRAASYPGPGIIPAERRTFYGTVVYVLQVKGRATTTGR